jgi:hypothetical protein
MNDKLTKRDTTLDLLRELERDDLLKVLEQVNPDDVQAAIQKIQPAVLHEYIGVMLSTPNDKVKYYMLKDMLKMGGHGGIQKVAVSKRVKITAEDRDWVAQVEEELLREDGDG